MESTSRIDVGTVFATYSETLEWLETLTERQAEEVVARLGAMPREGWDARLVAKSCVMPEFSDRFMSSAIVRSGTPTIFDTDDRALRIVERVLGAVEQYSAGYAWVHYQEEVEGALRFAMELARYASKIDAVEDLWSILRATRRENARFFDCWYDPVVEEALGDALEIEGIVDDGRVSHRSVERVGLMTNAEYDALVSREGPSRLAVATAEGVFFRRYPHGTFRRDKALDHFKTTGSPYYFTEVDAGLRHARPAETPAKWARPISKGGDQASRDEYEKFAKAEADAGFSVYGYWFSPEGETHSMATLQDHDRWIRSTGPGAPGFAGGRLEALSCGWVSMTMMNDYNPAANIAYRRGAENGRALRAAAKAVKRGGDFSSAVVEAYEADYRPSGYESFDDLRSAARHLNELAIGAKTAEPKLP